MIKVKVPQPFLFVGNSIIPQSKRSITPNPIKRFKSAILSTQKPNYPSNMLFALPELPLSKNKFRIFIRKDQPQTSRGSNLIEKFEKTMISSRDSFQNESHEKFQLTVSVNLPSNIPRNKPRTTIPKTRIKMRTKSQQAIRPKTVEKIYGDTRKEHQNRMKNANFDIEILKSIFLFIISYRKMLSNNFL